MVTKDIKILTIDDEPLVRESIVAYLEDSGFEMIEAENGRIGIEIFHREKPDLILCDLRMPEIDGLDVLATVTQESHEIPVIVVSGAGKIDDVIEALKLGAWDYVTKPIHDMAVLEHAVRRALERAQLLRDNRRYREHLEALNQELKASLQRLEDDEEAGRQIQFQLLPDELQTYGEYEFSHYLQTSMYLSGDFVDYFVIDKNHLGFYIADVSGHGASSAFVTVLLKSFMNRYLEAYRQDHNDLILHPNKVLKCLNNDVLTGHLDKYLTMFYGVINKKDRELSYSSGGQFPKPILFNGKKAVYLESKSLPVGLFHFAEYDTYRQSLPEAFIITLFSDGILEILGQQRLRDKETFLLSLINDMGVTIDAVIDQLALNDRGLLPDDITLLMVKRRA